MPAGARATSASGTSSGRCSPRAPSPSSARRSPTSGRAWPACTVTTSNRWSSRSSRESSTPRARSTCCATASASPGARATSRTSRRRRRGLGGRPQRRRRVARPAAEPLVLRVHGDPEGQDHRPVRPAGAQRQAGAVPRLQHAAGDRGGLHPRRAAALHRLRHLLPHREAGRRRPRVPEAPRLRRAWEVPEPPPGQRRPAHRGDRRALPRAVTTWTAARRRWSSPRRACTRCATCRRSSATSTSMATRISARSLPSAARSSTPTAARSSPRPA